MDFVQGQSEEHQRCTIRDKTNMHIIFSKIGIFLFPIIGEIFFELVILKFLSSSKIFDSSLKKFRYIKKIQLLQLKIVPFVKKKMNHTILCHSIVRQSNFSENNAIRRISDMEKKKFYKNKINVLGTQRILNSSYKILEKCFFF